MEKTSLESEAVEQISMQWSTDDGCYQLSTTDGMARLRRGTGTVEPIQRADYAILFSRGHHISSIAFSTDEDSDPG